MPTSIQRMIDWSAPGPASVSGEIVMASLAKHLDRAARRARDLSNRRARTGHAETPTPVGVGLARLHLPNQVKVSVAALEESVGS
jgi:hypothetical protein